MRKRSVVRGVFAAIVAHYAVLFGLLLLCWSMRPFVWAAIYGVPYQPVKGPMDPSSGEWLASQAIGFLSWVAGGFAACRWDKAGSNRSVLIVGVMFLALIVMSSAPATTDLVRMAILYFEIPLALIIGWLLLRRSERRSAVLIGTEAHE
jgi:hypothetical protein